MKRWQQFPRWLNQWMMLYIFVSWLQSLSDRPSFWHSDVPCLCCSTQTDLHHEAQVWWQRVYLDSQFSASSFCPYHLPQEASSKSSSHCCGLRVPSTPLEWQTALPFPYNLSSLQDILHTICTQCAAPTSCLGHPVYTQSRDGTLSWSEAL